MQWSQTFGADFWYWSLVLLGVASGLVLVTALALRVIVTTNEVHIVQSRRKTVSYGKDQAAGNSYYKWPAWVPLIGIRVIKFPVSVFDIKLDAYPAYDKGRVPFDVDILAFFRIEESDIAAQRVSSVKELEDQLRGILQGASRSILAQNPIEEILEERAKYGAMFTAATDAQLKAWGVVNVKNIELMDIRDAQGSHAIQNIMSIKQSLIAKDSRVAVAANAQAAETAEITAKQAVQVRQQEAEETVGVRTALRTQTIGVADQKAHQEIKVQEATTAEKEMAVKQVQEVRAAEIQRGVQVVTADQEKQTAVIRADGEKQKTITIAEGTLGAAKLHAEGIEVEGRARGEAEKAILLAPVNAQITLAKEIGNNAPYQTYLISVKQIEAGQIVGIEQAHALTAAQIKVIVNSGNVMEGVKDAMGLFTPKGGAQLGAMLEAFRNTDAGKAVVEAVIGDKSSVNGASAPPAHHPV